jgi:hypothetical protein
LWADSNAKHNESPVIRGGTIVMPDPAALWFRFANMREAYESEEFRNTCSRRQTLLADRNIKVYAL